MRNKVELKNGTILEVGNKYRLPHWGINEYIELIY